MADWRAGGQNQGLYQAIGFVQASGIWIGVGDEEWHKSKPQMSGRQRYSQTHYFTIRKYRRGTADE